MTAIRSDSGRARNSSILVRLLGFMAAVSLPLLLLDACISLHSASDVPASAGLTGATDPCARPAAGSVVADPENLRSQHGVLDVDLAIHNHREADGSIRYCYTLPDGAQAPTLRLHPGDWLILHLTNALTDLGANSASNAMSRQAPNTGGHGRPMCKVPRPPRTGPCAGGAMSPLATNLHFHGLTVPPVCHQDDVLKTLIEPGDPPFEYRFRIPDDEPPGLYWYHPHVHGFSAMEVGGGASGALIVEGIERATPLVAGLPERVLVIRDVRLIHPVPPPAAGPARNIVATPMVQYDREGDVISTGTGTGMPARDLSINGVPVPYPDYPPATIALKPDERQLWRVVNASSLTYLDLAVRSGTVQQTLGLVAIDGVPVNHAGGTAPTALWLTHISLPPGARAEFIVTGPPAGAAATLVTHWVDTGPGGENDPDRPLATVTARTDAPEPPAILPLAHEPLPPPRFGWIGDIEPVRVRRLYFSEQLADPSNPASATAFFLTEEGKKPVAFDPAAKEPDIVVRQGDVEDWIIENRSAEVHAFHIHQLHFQLRDYGDKSINEPFLRDTINVPYYRPGMQEYPSVRLRMDFRDPDAVGTFVYHCHLLEHEDGGMMGTIRVEPAGPIGSATSPAAGTASRRN